MKIEITDKFKNHLSDLLKIKVKKIDILANGGHNFNYVIKGENNEKYLLRFFGKNQYDNAKKEYEILKKIEYLNISPKVYFIDESMKFFKYKYLIEEFIIGETLQKFNSEIIIKLAKILKKIHSIKGEGKNENEDNSSFKKCEITLSNAEQYLNKTIYTNILNIFKKYEKKIETFNILISKGSNNHLTHNDLIPQNMIFKKDTDELILIDWELSKFSNFYFDFGSLFGEIEVEKSLEELFYKEYGIDFENKDKEIINLIKIERSFGFLNWLLERIILNKTKNILDDGYGINYLEEIENVLKKLNF